MYFTHQKVSPTNYYYYYYHYSKIEMVFLPLPLQKSCGTISFWYHSRQSFHSTSCYFVSDDNLLLALQYAGVRARGGGGGSREIAYISK